MALKNEEKLQSYLKITKNIDIEKVKEKYQNISEDDVNMCISLSINDASQIIGSNLIGATYGFSNMREVGESSLGILKKDFLDLSQYFFRKQKDFNNNFRIKKDQYGYEQNYAENPFYISKNVYDGQFENLEKDSDLDIYAKTLYWSNKVVKQIESVRENVVDDILSKGGIVKDLNRFENKCKLQFSDEESKENLRDEYISKYKDYLEGKISKEQLENENAYMKMENNLIEEFENGLEMSPEDAFKYLSLSKNIRTLYLLKDSCIENIISSYSKLQENDEKNKELAIYQENESGGRKNLTQKTNSVILNILVKGTNVPIQVHCSPAFLDDMQNCYSTLIPEGKVKLDYRNLLYVKYNDKEKEQIEEMNSMLNKEELDYDVREYIEEQYNMCNDLDKIKVIKKTREFENR